MICLLPAYPAHIDITPMLSFMGLLCNPRNGRVGVINKYPTAKWAGDNDCFNGNFDPIKFQTWLRKIYSCRERCLFITAPDVVANAEATIRQFPEWSEKIRSLGYPVAFALQDGVKESDIPWDLCDAVFLGGSTKFKLSQEAIQLLLIAKEYGKWRHVGRINTIKRVTHFWNYADSFDGTDFIFHPNESIKDTVYIMTWRQQQIELMPNLSRNPEGTRALPDKTRGLA